MATPETTRSTGEITVLCKTHNRRCMLHQVPGFPARLAHISRAGDASEYCESVQFTVREEYPADRDSVFAALIPVDDEAEL